MIDEKKLIEDIAEFMSNVYGCDLDEVIEFQTNNESKAAYIVQGLCEAVGLIKEQTKVNEWIPCSERLPEVDQMVLATEEEGVIFCTYEYFYGYGYGFYPIHGNVTAWMPLPEPYIRKKVNE